MRVVLLCLGALMMALAGCVVPDQPNSTDAEVAAVRYRHPGPNSITLITMVSNRTGNGTHSALLINAPYERVLFDPAGAFKLDGVPEQGDVLFGITPQIFKYYKSAHARSTYNVSTQYLEVTPEQAETAYRLALQNGAVGQVMCTINVSRVLQQVPGFESIQPVLQPTKLRDQFAKFPGVVSEAYFEDDEGNVKDGVAAAQAQKEVDESGTTPEPATEDEG